MMSPDQLKMIENRPPGDRLAYAESDIRRLVLEIRRFSNELERMREHLRLTKKGKS